MRFCHSCFEAVTPKAGSNSLVWICDLEGGFCPVNPSLTSPSGIAPQASFSVVLQKVLWKEALKKEELTQINAHCTDPIKPGVHTKALGGKHLKNALRDRAMGGVSSRGGVDSTWPFKWTLGHYAFMPACSVLFPQESNWNRLANSLIRHIKCPLYHIQRGSL